MHKVRNTKERLVSFHKFTHFVVYCGGDCEGLEKRWNLSKICEEILGMEGERRHFTIIYYNTKCA